MNTATKPAAVRRFFTRNASTLLIFAFMLALMIVSGALNPDFFTWRNFRNLMVTAFPLLIVAMGQTLVIFTSGIDLSLGGIVALSNVACVSLMNTETSLGFLPAVLAALVIGAACGSLNGLAVSKGKLAPIIVTLATAAIYDGMALFIMPKPGGRVHSAFGRFITRGWGGIFPFVLAAVIVTLVFFLANRSPYGKSLRAIGGNENAAFSTGVRVDRVKLIAFMLAGLLSAVAGVFLSGQMNSGDATIGGTYAMNSITASVVGGTAMSGAVGNPLGSVAGVFIIVIINNMLNLFAVPSFYQFVLQGLILIAALALGALRKKK